MEKKFSGKIWKFGNDIDTDTIIPGKRGTIPDRNEMKKYAFELLKPDVSSSTVTALLSETCHFKV